MSKLIIQRVRSPATGQVGVNCYLSNDMDQTVSESYEVLPGGNLVDSYLDLTASPATSIADVLTQLSANDIENSYAPQSSDTPDFDWTFQLFESGQSSTEVTPESEFVTLVSKGLEFINATKGLPLGSGRRVVVIADRLNDGWAFTLSEEAAQRLSLLPLTPAAGTTIRLEQSVANDFHSMNQSNLLTPILTALTGASMNQLVRLGGVSFMERNGGELATWPEYS